MNNATNLAIAAILMAAILVVGATFSTTTTQLTAFAYQKKKVGAQDGGSRNGNNANTVTIEECKNRGSASGFDTTVDQECENLICTHPGNNATCTQEGIRSTPTPTPEPTTTTLRVIKKVVCLPTDPNCSLSNNCQILGDGSQPFECQSAIGNGVLIALQPGDEFGLVEIGAGPFDVTFEGDCTGTIAAGQHLTCTVTNTER